MRKVTFLAAAAATLLAACSQQGPGESAPAAASTAGGAAASGTPVIGLALSTQNNPFFVELKDGAQKAAKDAGVQLVVVDAQDDPARQISSVPLRVIWFRLPPRRLRFTCR